MTHYSLNFLKGLYRGVWKGVLQELLRGLQTTYSSYAIMMLAGYYAFQFSCWSDSRSSNVGAKKIIDIVVLQL